MKKRLTCYGYSPLAKQILKKMKLTVLLLTIAILSGYATDSYSQAARLTLNIDNNSIKNVLKEIEKQSEFRFFYSGEVDVESSASVSVINKNVMETLDELFKGTGIRYEIYGRQIALLAKQETAMPAGIQQTGVITGKVTDRTGAPLPGVTVVVKETSTGTITDGNGNYSLSNIPANSTLVFSFVGMRMQEVIIGTQTIINVSLQEETFGIDEVVAIGYGTQRKRDITGAVGSISSNDLINAPASNASQILQGRIAGVMVTPESGAPGSAVNVRIRGIGTVNNNDPLYVIDGMPSNTMSNINPLDIESIEILKDASASAIYGARAANGVVLITTKKGSVGKTNIHFDSYMGISAAWKEPKRLNSDQYYDLYKTAFENSNQPVDPNLESAYALGHNTNWWDEITQDATVQNHYLSVSGGTEKVRYSVSGGYFKEEGFIKKSDFDRISFRINTDFNLSKRVKAGVNLGIINTSRNYSELGDGGIGVEPFIAAIDPSKDPNMPNYEFEKFMVPRMSDWKNPSGEIARTFDLKKDFGVQGNVYLDFNLWSGLGFRTNLGLGNSHFNSYGFSPKYYLGPRDNAPQSSVGRGYTNSQSFVWESTFTFTRKISIDHDLTLLAGTSAESFLHNSFSASKQNTPSNDIYQRTIGAATANPMADGSIGSNALLSIFGRLNYSHKDKYLLTANLRRDGSSRFAEEKKWGIFPSVSLGWRISEESFFKNLNAGVIDYVKIRAGWGEIGNQNIADNAYLSLISGGNTRRYVFGNTVFQGYSPSNVGNPDIQWETVEQTNVAVDIVLFKSKLSLTADYYIKNTKGMLLRLPLVYYSGYPNDPWDNAGTVQNKGLELELKHQNKISEFNYEIAFNFSTLHNEVKSMGLGVPLFGRVSKTEVGHPIGSYYGFIMDGIFQNEAEVAKGLQPNAKPGDIRFKDIAGPKDANGNFTRPDGKIDDNDRTHIGNPIPKFLFGTNINLNYKNFDFALFLQGIADVDRYSNFTRLNLDGRKNVELSQFLGAWRGEGTSNLQPRISLIDQNNNYRASTYFVEDGSYLRIKNIQIGYTLPGYVSNLVNVSSIRIYASGQNIWTFTNFSGLDPEKGASSPLNVGTDIDRTVTPQPRTIMGGISVNF